MFKLPDELPRADPSKARGGLSQRPAMLRTRSE